MYGFLRQSTATTVRTGPFLSPTDGITAKTALSAPTQVATNGATGFALVKAGARAALAGSLTAPAGWAHDALGYYPVSLATGDLDTVGRLRLEFVDPANYAPVHMDYVVLSQPVYDSLFGSVALSTFAGGAVASVTAPVNVVGDVQFPYGTVVSGTTSSFVVSGLPAGIARGQKLAKGTISGGVITLTGAARIIGTATFDSPTSGLYTFALNGADEAGAWSAIAAGEVVAVTP